MAEIDASDALLSVPKSVRPRRRRMRGKPRGDNPEPRREDRLGRIMESVARASGTPGFLLVLSIFVIFWIAWNSTAPEEWRFDSSALGFTVLTLALSLQASYAAPMILLAQNRQDDRDKVQIEQDRQRAQRNTADLEYLTREIVALRMQIKDMASKDFIRAELRGLLEDIEELSDEDEVADSASVGPQNTSPADKRAQARRLLEKRAATRLEPEPYGDHD